MATKPVNSMSYRTTPLFGGAITAPLPTHFKDASTLRTIPSNQELYLSTSTTTTNNTTITIILEILEYAGPPAHPCSTDEEALRYHYDDMVQAGYTTSKGDVEEVTRVFRAGGEGEGEGKGEEWEVEVPSLVGVEGTRVLGCLGVQVPVTNTKHLNGTSEQGVDGADEVTGGTNSEDTNTDFTALATALIRLPSKETDILVTVAIPHVAGEYDAGSVDLEEGKWGPLIEEGVGVRREVLRGLEIREWGLFDG